MADDEVASIEPAPPVPRHLGEYGTKLWLDCAPPKYTMRPDELRLLTECCREVDIIDRLEDALRDDDLMVAGQGLRNMVVNPLVSELRQHRATLTTMFRALQLPDSSSGVAQKRQLVSEQNTKAARTRWDKFQIVS